MRSSTTDAWGVTRNLILEPDGRLVAETVQDVEPILERNKRLQNDHDGKTAEGMRWAAQVPLVVVELWYRKYGVWLWNKNHWPKIKRLLNDPEWRWLRVWPGKL